MSEAVTHSATAPVARPELLASLDPLLREWLPRQRWFAGKGRPVTGFSLVAAVELLPPTAPLGLIHLLVRAHQPRTPTQGAPSRPGDCYQLLIGVREALPPRLAPALIGHPKEGPLMRPDGVRGAVRPAPRRCPPGSPAQRGPRR